MFDFHATKRLYVSHTERGCIRCMYPGFIAVSPSDFLQLASALSIQGAQASSQVFFHRLDAACGALVVTDYGTATGERECRLLG